MFEVTNLKKSYDKFSKEVLVLDQLNFSAGEGEFVGIFGASGSGKSTFLHILGGLDKPKNKSEGEVKFNGVSIYDCSDTELARYRNSSIGFVFQFYHLLPEFSALENVMLPCLIGGLKRHEAYKRSVAAIKMVELEHRESHRPSELSGGEQQRIAIARAIVMKPKYILADEPTGNLDEVSGNRIFSFLKRLHAGEKTGIIMVTHNPDLLKMMPRRLELRGGRLHDA